MANLTQLRMLEGLNAVLLVDKPAGIAFTTVVKTVKRKFNLVKVGHGGSLDAAASGLLVLLVNDANRYVGDVMGADRAYEGRMRLGLATNTHDVHGAEISRASAGEVAAAATPERMAAVRDELTGDVFQTEPGFSTIRREGSAGYEIAETGAHQPFLAHVYSFDVGPFKPGEDVAFSLAATKGLLVRTLVNDFGASLGTGASLASLRRTRVGRFTLGDAVAFDRLLELELADFAAVTKPLSVFG